MSLLPYNKWGLGLFDFDEVFSPLFTSNLETNNIKADIYETDKDYVLKLNVPGYKKEDITIELDNGYLEVTAKNTKEKIDKSNHEYITRERKTGTISRSFYVGDVSEESITPSLQDGILKITFPIKEVKPEKKQIKIK